MTEAGSINQVSLIGKKFVEKYYRMFDEKRDGLLDLYPPDTPNLSEWNGHALSTRDEVLLYLQSLPPTKHNVQMIDAQPLPGNSQADSFLLVVQGTVTYDSEHHREFYQRLVLRKGPDNKYYIMNDYYRWIGEK